MSDIPPRDSLHLFIDKLFYYGCSSIAVAAFAYVPGVNPGMRCYR